LLERFRPRLTSGRTAGRSFDVSTTDWVVTDTNAARDGRFRRIRCESSRPGVKMTYAGGYLRSGDSGTSKRDDSAARPAGSGKPFGFSLPSGTAGVIVPAPIPHPRYPPANSSRMDACVRGGVWAGSHERYFIPQTTIRIYAAQPLNVLGMGPSGKVDGGTDTGHGTDALKVSPNVQAKDCAYNSGCRCFCPPGGYHPDICGARKPECGSLEDAFETDITPFQSLHNRARLKMSSMCWQRAIASPPARQKMDNTCWVRDGLRSVPSAHPPTPCFPPGST